ncbi:MAG TPA: isochorismatase family protein [Chloroflexota bacterium]|nr:isochorismatase family protein [Chloroflexota bacterium]
MLRIDFVRQALRARVAHLASLAIASALLTAIPPQSGSARAQEAPPLPDPVPVTLDASTTAYLVLDMNDRVCLQYPACVDSIGTVARFLDRAREAGALVVYSTTTGGNVLPEVAPREGEPVVTGRSDKFYQTDLADILASHGIQTAVLVGVSANGAVLYTSFQANLRGYTVVVAQDGISSPDDFTTYVAQYQLLHEPGFANADNTPLAEARVTLSRTDLISFR